MDYTVVQDGFIILRSRDIPSTSGFILPTTNTFFLQEHSVHAQVGRDKPIRSPEPGVKSSPCLRTVVFQ